MISGSALEVVILYDSLKPWINVPVAIRPFRKRSGTGDKLYKDTVDTLCYPHGHTKIVRNYLGADVVSQTQLYVDGSTAVSTLDNVIFEAEEYPIQAIDTFYRDGKPDIKVVYL